MNVKYKLHGILFEGDSKKASTNLRDHGISFKTASEVFHDPFVQVVDEAGNVAVDDSDGHYYAVTSKDHSIYLPVVLRNNHP